MDFLTKQFSIGETEIYLLQFGEFEPSAYLRHLTNQETERHLTFQHLKRQREFIATRILRHNIFGFKHIHYNTVGAPYIQDEGFISISHAPKLVGIALNRKFQIGLDLEIIQEKAMRLHSKFLNSSEMEIFDTGNAQLMTQCWSAKETLYKLAGRKLIDFKNDLLLSKNETDNWQGEIINPNENILVDLHQFVHEDYIVSFNTNAIQISERR